jgi:hypothetical protein
MLLPWLLAAQGLLGALDTLLNHELLERLPRRVEARSEIGLHSIREAIYAALFAGLGWFEWHGALALVIAALLVAEIVVDAIDEWTENRIRVLPQNERVLHFMLVLNLGAIALLVASALGGWYGEPSALVLRDAGWLSWLLAFFAASSAAWSVRDFLAWRRLGYEQASARRP